jgi:predicted ATPase/class 3 adenylate cyclase
VRERNLPVGTVTFLFSDIEGSTLLGQVLGPERYGAVLERHRALLREAFEDGGGTEVGTEGDSFFVVFERPAAAVGAAADAQRRLAAEPWPDDGTVRVRMGIHSGEGILAGGTYVGNDVNRAARIAAAGHGGQVLLSETTSALVADGLPEGTMLRPLGEHRLKDLRPERLCQLVVDGLPAEFPPIRSLDARPNNLPTQLTTFVGREKELTEAETLLARARLLTLTGPGGTGKTRLSLELAARMAERFPDGVFFVPLEPITDASLVPATIAQMLGLPDRGGRSPVERLVDHLANRRVLLVLDNLEQVRSGAPVIGELLTGASQLTVLATSRAALHVYGELEYPVPPLGVPERRDVPDAGALGRYESVALFVERAMAVRPSFRLTDKDAPAVAEICYRLDGLPLAIELAAARVKLLSPQAILARLENRLALLSGGAQDLPARQQTLRGAIAWSFDLLDNADRSLFAGLAVFVGGASLEAIEAVCGPDQTGDVLDGLASLVDKSLLRQGEGIDGEPRFTMLETIREYAAEQLAEAGRSDTLRDRHAAWFLGVAETAGATLMAQDKRAGLDRLEFEHDNLRAALAWATTARHAETALRLGTALWRFWQMRGYLDEGAERLKSILALPECADYVEQRLAALDAAGGLAYWRGDYEASRAYYTEALEARRVTGEPRAIAESLYNLSFTHTFTRGTDQSRALIEESRALFDTAGDKAGAAKALWALSNLEYTSANIPAARRYAIEALATFEAIGDAFMTGWAKYTVGIADLIEGDLAAAGRWFREALEIFDQSADTSGYTLIIDSMGAAALRAGDRQRAARIAGAVSTLERTTGTALNTSNRQFVGWDPEPLRTDPDTADAYAAGERMGIREIVAYALAKGGGEP